MAFKHASTADSHAGEWEVPGRIVRSTDKAVLFDDGKGKKWLPKKSVTIVEHGNGSATVFMPDWLNKKPYAKEENARDVA